MNKTGSLIVYVPVPNNIIEKLEKRFGNSTSYSKALDIVKMIIYKHQRNFAPMLHFFPYDYKFKRTVVGGNEFYYIWGQLEEMGILEVKILDSGREFSTAGKVCKYYRLFPDSLNGDVVSLGYSKKYIVSVIQDENMCKAVKDSLIHLKVSVPAENIESITENLSEESLLKKFLITESGIQYYYMKDWYPVNIQDQVKTRYLSFERINMAMSYKNALKMIEAKNFYVSRCETNGRIYHNLVNLPSELLELITINNETICEIDLSCSQPVLLAYLINEVRNNRRPIIKDKFLEQVIKNQLPPLLFSSSCPNSELDQLSDIAVFIEKAQAGKLYEYFSIELYGECTEASRQEAKDCFIESLYSQSHIQTANKIKFATVFPDLTLLLKMMKTDLVSYFEEHMCQGSHPELKKYTHSKSKGNKTAFQSGHDYLAVKLQEIESAIFVDMILPDLHQKGYKVLTKHDSILCPESDELSVKDLIMHHLDSILGKGNYRIKSKLISGQKRINSTENWGNICPNSE